LNRGGSMNALKLSIKKLKQLHQNIGGNNNGFYITTFGHCITTGKSISIKNYIATAQKESANWSYWLVSGDERDD